MTRQLSLCEEALVANVALFLEDSREMSLLMASQLLLAFEL